MMRWLLPIIATLLLPACLASANGDGALSQDALPQGGADICGAAEHADLIGQPLAVAQARAETLQQRVRIYGPSAVVTMDYLERRINFEHDIEGIVRRIRCG